MRIELRKGNSALTDRNTCSQRTTDRTRCTAERSDSTAECGGRSEEHTSELQSRLHLVCRLLLEKKNVLVVLDEEQHGQLQVARGIERLPELPLARRAVSRRDVHELVAMDWLLCDRLDPVVTEPRLRTSDGLEQLRTGGARLADDV